MYTNLGSCWVIRQAYHCKIKRIQQEVHSKETGKFGFYWCTSVIFF